MYKRPITLACFLLASLLASVLTIPAGADAPSDNAVINAWLEAWNTGAVDFDSFLTEDVSFRDPFYSKTGHQGYSDLVTIARSSFKDIDFTADDMIVDGDRCALSWTVSATHVGSGKAVRVRGISILRLEGGKIADEWRVYDGAGLMRQINGDGGDGGG